MFISFKGKSVVEFECKMERPIDALNFQAGLLLPLQPVGYSHLQLARLIQQQRAG